MAYKSPKKVRVPPNSTPTPKQVNDLQDNLVSAINQLTGNDILDRVLLTDIVLQPGVINQVSHKLGRNLKGWHIVRTHGGFPLVYDVQDDNSSPNLLLSLMSATVITVDIEVF
jgi:hypothetical protein